MHVSEDRPPPLPPRPRPRAVEPWRELPHPPEPFRTADTPPSGLARPIETLADLGLELRSVRREIASLRVSSSPPPPITSAPPPPKSRAAQVATGTWKGTQWLGVVTLALTLAAQVASWVKPGLAGPLQRAVDALETLAR